MAESKRNSPTLQQPINARPADCKGTADVLNIISANTLLATLQEGCVAVDASGAVKFINRAAQDLLAVSHGEARGKALHELFTLLDSETRKPISKPLDYLVARARNASFGGCELLKRRDGNIVPFIYSISELTSAPGAGSTATLILLHNASHIYARMERLKKAASLDDHTRLLRRAELHRRLTRVLETMSDRECHALLFMDLDHFKAVNDSFGHAAGDRVLLEVVRRLRNNVRNRDTLARLGGDEFGLLLEHCPPAQARARAKRLRAAITDQEFLVDGRRVSLDVSIGIALMRRGYQSAEAVLATADRACYAAKRRRASGAHIEKLLIA